MKFNVWYTLFFVFLLFQCQPDTTHTDRLDLMEVMPGTWEAISVDVTVNSVNNTDSAYVFSIKESDWKRKLGVQPLRHFYAADRNYRRESRSVNDTLIDLTRGKWFINGDSIRLVTPDATYEYEVTVNNGISTFRSLLDWDNDGAQDDEYIGVQRKISRYTE